MAEGMVQASKPGVPDAVLVGVLRSEVVTLQPQG